MCHIRTLYVVVSPSGKAADFDSVTSWVRFPPPQPLHHIRAARCIIKQLPLLKDRGFLTESEVVKWLKSKDNGTM